MSYQQQLATTRVATNLASSIEAKDISDNYQNASVSLYADLGIDLLVQSKPSTIDAIAHYRKEDKKVIMVEMLAALVARSMQTRPEEQTFLPSTRELFLADY